MSQTAVAAIEQNEKGEEEVKVKAQRVDKLEALNALLEQEKELLKRQLNKEHYENDGQSLEKKVLEQKMNINTRVRSGTVTTPFFNGSSYETADLQVTA